MNPERLLEHYHRIADAEDAVPRLRRFVLDLAVRGKLVEQDLADEPVAELLKRIAVEKARLVKAGEVRKKAAQDPKMITALHKLPINWRWVSLGSIFLYDAGTKRESQSLDPSFWLLELKDVEKETGRLFARINVSDRDSKSTKSEFKVRDILYGKLRPYLTKVLVADEPGYSTTEIVAIRPFVPLCSEYCALALRRPDFVDYVTRLGQGTKMPRLRTEDAVVSPFPLPPLAEQHRIAAKVDELMALCDQLETARSEREATRDRLIAASLARLTAPETEQEDFPTHTRFALDALPALTARPSQIKALRQTILNLAVRGKLVEQSSTDEPAAALLQRIAVEKMRLVEERVARKSKALPKVTRDDIPFALPDGWALGRIGDICSKTGSGSTPRGGKKVYKKAGVQFFRSQNVHDDGLRLEDVAFIDPLVHARMKGTRVLPGDLLLNITGGSMGRCALAHADCGEANVSQHVAIIRPAVKGIERFLHRLVLSPYFQAYIFDEQTGAGRGGLPKKKMDEIMVALPPLAEQQRIVTKVDELMTICDQLETTLTTADTTRQRLLDSLLHETLATKESCGVAA